jgi:hypothetical protein
MAVTINAETGFIESDDTRTYSREDLTKLRLRCPECKVIVLPRPRSVGNVEDKRYRPATAWKCINGHGSPATV